MNLKLASQIKSSELKLHSNAIATIVARPEIHDLVPRHGRQFSSTLIKLTGGETLFLHVAAALSVPAKYRSRLRHAARGDTELPLSNAFSYYKRELESSLPRAVSSRLAELNYTR